MAPFDDLVPVALVRSRDGAVVAANALAEGTLGVTAADLRGDGLLAGLYAADALTLRSLLERATSEPSEPVVVRWGAAPPVTFLEVRARRTDDGEVLLALVDTSDQHRLDTAVSARGSALFITDEAGIVQWMSPGSSTVLAVDPHVFIGIDIASLTHPDDQDLLERTMKNLENHPGAELSRAYRFRHPLVEDTWWNLRATSVYLPDDPSIGGILVRLDVILESAHGDGAEGDDDRPKLHSIAELTPTGIIAAAGGRINLRNALARQMVGPLLDDPDQFRWAEAARPDDGEHLLRVLTSAARDGDRGGVRAAFDQPDGSTTWLRIDVLPTTGGSGRFVGYVATLMDVTAETTAREELQAAQAQLWELANHDALTGLPNRMHFGDRLGQALARSRREHHGVALLYGDLDAFKPVNDTLGHDAGDRVLVEAGHRIHEVTRETDTVCRYGGDEFVVLCEGFSSLDEIETVAERVVESVRRPFAIDGADVFVGISVGVAEADLSSTADQLLTAADDAMYAAKRAGKGRVVLAGS